MFIASVHVRHFRCIKDATLECEPLTALVGATGCGKSTFLKAVDIFFSPDTRILEEDFYARDTTSDIEITIEFQELDTAYLDALAPYAQAGSLKITRIFSWGTGRASTRFFGYTARHEGFAPLRAANAVAQQRPLYDALRADALCQELPPWTKQADLAGALKEWEESHPDQCSPQRDDGMTFGLGPAVKFDLGRLVQVVFIPAVRDAVADATDMRGSPFTELLDIAFRSGMSEREDYQALEADVEYRYDQIIEDAKQHQFQDVEERLSRTMRTFVNDTSVKLVWHDRAKVSIPPPSADVLIVEDGYQSPVSRTGHGVQRAFTLSLLQEITAARLGFDRDNGHSSPEFQAPLSILLLIIEEPELFQHPNRQRSIARTLQELSSGSIPGVAERTQVLYGTHNTHFVAIDRVEQVRVLRKVEAATGAPKTTSVKQFNLDVFLHELSVCRDKDEPVGDWAFHQTKLISIMTSTVNEGLFAKGVILVEGDIDRAGIIAASKLSGMFLEDLGISVIQGRGKANLVRLSIIFRQLGIDVFVVWDGDADRNGSDRDNEQRRKENRELHRLVGIDPIDPAVTNISETFACIATNLEKQVAKELGEFHNEFMRESKERYGIDGNNAPIKHPVVFEGLLKEARDRGLASATLDAIIERIRCMVNRL